MRTAWALTRQIVRWVLFGGLVVALVYLLGDIFGVRPPREFTIATGREGGAYYSFAEKYKARLAEEGHTLHIRPTAGSIETIHLLQSGEVDAGFVQSTAPADADVSGLNALASLYYEALWILYRKDLPQPPTRVPDLKGLRIGVGEEGSGTNASAVRVLALNGVDSENSTFLAAPWSETAAQLKAGELDVMILVAGAESPLLTELLIEPGIELLPIDRAEAYTSHNKNIYSVVLHEGAIDLKQNIPAEDKKLIAATATLVASENLHPDLARLLLIIATEIHSPGGILENAGEFPASVSVSIPMNQDAVRYLENGPTGLERVLPLWMASRLERIVFLLLPAALILFPLFRGTPLALSFLNRYRLKRRYIFLREIDQRTSALDRDELNKAIARLEAFEQDISDRMNVPTSLLDEYYELRLHTALALERLQARKRAGVGPEQGSASEDDSSPDASAAHARR